MSLEWYFVRKRRRNWFKVHMGMIDFQKPFELFQYFHKNLIISRQFNKKKLLPSEQPIANSFVLLSRRVGALPWNNRQERGHESRIVKQNMRQTDWGMCRFAFPATTISCLMWWDRRDWYEMIAGISSRVRVKSEHTQRTVTCTDLHALHDFLYYEIHTFIYLRLSFLFWHDLLCLFPDFVAAGCGSTTATRRWSSPLSLAV